MLLTVETLNEILGVQLQTYTERYTRTNIVFSNITSSAIVNIFFKKAVFICILNNIKRKIELIRNHE